MNTWTDKEQEVLKLLEHDVSMLKAELKETADAIVQGEYSNYPILLAHSEDIAIAVKVIDKETYQTAYSFSASTLEELVSRGIVMKDKEAGLKKQIEDQKDQYCLLLVHPEAMRFIFTPLK